MPILSLKTGAPKQLHRFYRCCIAISFRCAHLDVAQCPQWTHRPQWPSGQTEPVEVPHGPLMNTACVRWWYLFLCLSGEDEGDDGEDDVGEPDTGGGGEVAVVSEGGAESGQEDKDGAETDAEG